MREREKKIKDEVERKKMEEAGRESAQKKMRSK